MRFTTLLGLLLLFTNLAWADSYKIDPAHTSIVFKINHLGFSNVYGMFTGAEGQFTIDDAKPEKSMLQISVPAESVITLNQKRDDHLKSPDFFNVKQFPIISFKSHSVQKIDATHYRINGNLTLHGVTQPVTFIFTRQNTGKGPMGETRTGGDTNLKLKRSAYNMTFMNGKVGDEVELMMSVEGIKI